MAELLNDVFRSRPAYAADVDADDGDDTLNPFALIRSLGVLLRNSWVGAVLRSAPAWVVALVMVQAAAWVAVSAVDVKRAAERERKPQQPQKTAGDGRVFFLAYVFSAVIVGAGVVGALHTWASGVPPIGAMVGVVLSVAGVGASVAFDALLPRPPPAASADEEDKQVRERMLYLHTTVGVLLAVAISAIPWACPLTAD